MASFTVDECFEVRHALGQHTAVMRLRNDDLLLMYGDLTDQMEDQTGYVLRSTDSGRSWSDPELVLRPRWWHGGTHTSLGMQVLRSGRALVPWTHGANIKRHKGARTRFVCLRSDDEGGSWQGWDEQPLPTHRLSPYGTIQELDDGTVLCTAWGQESPDDPYTGTVFVLASDDGGISWSEYSRITDRHQIGSNETAMTRLPDGRLLALIRSDTVKSESGAHLCWVYQSFSSDAGRTWTEPQTASVLANNFNAWITDRGTLVAACRGIDGTGRLRAQEIRPDDPRHTEQRGYGIQLFVGTIDGPSVRWRYELTLPDPAGRAYTAHHEAGEPAFCTLPDGRLFVAFYSYAESIIDQIADRPPNDFVAGELRRIPHVFKRRICAAIISEE